MQRQIPRSLSVQDRVQSANCDDRRRSAVRLCVDTCRTTRPLDGTQHARYLPMYLPGPTRAGTLQLQRIRVAMNFRVTSNSGCVPHVAPGIERVLKYVFQRVEYQTMRPGRHLTTLGSAVYGTLCGCR
jgi:hypothetical protein